MQALETQSLSSTVSCRLLVTLLRLGEITSEGCTLHGAEEHADVIQLGFLEIISSRFEMAHPKASL